MNTDRSQAGYALMDPAFLQVLARSDSGRHAQVGAAPSAAVAGGRWARLRTAFARLHHAPGLPGR